MIYLLLAILCSALISTVMRISTERIKGNISMLAINYLMCLVLALLHTGVRGLFPSSPALPATIGFGIVSGALYLCGFLMFQFCVRRSGMVLSSIFMKLGLLVPMLLSIFLFGEIPSTVQVLGFILAVGSIILINSGEKGDSKCGRFGISLILLLLAGGSCDATNKIFEELFPAELSSQFLLYTFAFALIFCLILMLCRGERPGKWEILFGILIGLPNYYCSRFLLLSLGSVPAVIAYPSFSVGTILLVTLTGLFVFREKLSSRRWIALGIITLALVLLNI